MADGAAATGLALGLREIALALRYWPYSLALLITLLGMAGVIGRGVGLPNLFRDDDQLFDPKHRWRPDWTPEPQGGWFSLTLASPAFWSGFGFMAAFGLFWMIVPAGHDCAIQADCVRRPALLLPDGEQDTAFRHTLFALAAAVILLVIANYHELARLRADFVRLRPGRIAAELARLGAGAVLGVAVTIVGYLLPFTLAKASGSAGWLTQHAYIVPGAAFVGFVLWRQNALVCTSIFSFVIAIMLPDAVFPAWLSPWIGYLILVLVAVVIFLNGWPGKYRIPGFEPALPTTRLNPQVHGSDAAAVDQPESGDGGAGHPPGVQVSLIPPTEALGAWRRRMGTKPVLVMVATSGGAYRATFWTSLILDHLIGNSGPRCPLEGLKDNIRLFTGASGGMVAAAYFVAMTAEGKLAYGVTRRISDDTREALRRREGRKHPIARDSLSPVVHQMLRRDLPFTLSRRPQQMDRGRALEQQWGTLGVSFGALIDAERRGEVPSIILSPMLVETGALALFSNLELGPIRRENIPMPRKPGDEDKSSVEIFDKFPHAHAAMRLATATRLNATFPYISPAISLPVWPERRPVDAGYFDNYGINLLAAYLQDEATRAWIHQHCARLAIIQVRAFPSEEPTAPASPLARALQFASSPPEGLFSARKASQIFRNDQLLVRLAARYATPSEPEFLKVFTFEANTDVSLSWYQRDDEMRAMAGLLVPPRRAEIPVDGAVPSPEAANQVVSSAEIRTWAEREFGSWDDVIRLVQQDNPGALRSQYLHHRAKTAEQFTALERFWSWR